MQRHNPVVHAFVRAQTRECEPLVGQSVFRWPIGSVFEAQVKGLALCEPFCPQASSYLTEQSGRLRCQAVYGAIEEEGPVDFSPTSPSGPLRAASVSDV